MADFSNQSSVLFFDRQESIQFRFNTTEIFEALSMKTLSGNGNAPSVEWEWLIDEADRAPRAMAINQSMLANVSWKGAYFITLSGHERFRVEEFTQCVKSADDKRSYYGFIRRLPEFRESRRWTRNFYNSLQDAVERASILSVTDLEGRIIYANEQFCDYSGYSLDELSGNTHRILKSGVHDAGVFVDLWETILLGKVWRGEICNKSKTGELHWMDTVITPVFNSKGEIFQFLSIRSSITEKKMAQLALQESEQFSKSVLSTLKSSIAVFGDNGILSFVNRKWERGLVEDCSLNHAQLGIGDNLVSHIQQAYSTGNVFAGMIWRSLNMVLNQQKDHLTFEFPCNLGGVNKWLLVSITRLSELSDQILIRFTDVSEQKYLEANLALSHEKYEALLLNMQDALYTDDAQGNITYVNSRFLEMFSFDENMLNKVTIADLVHPACRKNIQEAQQLRVSGKECNDVLEFRAFCGNEQEKWYEARVTTLLADGVIVGSQGLVREVTEKKILISHLEEKEARLKKTIRELESRNEELIQFSYIISHNLRSPLSNIVGLTKMLPKVIHDQERVIKFSSLIDQSASQMDEVVKELAEILAIHSIAEENFTKENVLDIIKKQALTLELLDCLSLEWEGGVRDIITFKPFLDSVIYNVLSNAKKYKSPLRELELKCLIRFEPHEIQLIFSDNGLGIDLKRVGADLFGLYRRFHEGVAEGRGLGLFMTRKQVELIGGTISLESQLEIGTKVLISLMDKTN